METSPKKKGLMSVISLLRAPSISGLLASCVHENQHAIEGYAMLSHLTLKLSSDSKEF